MSTVQVFTGICPDDGCNTRLYITHIQKSVLCHSCGQHRTIQEMQRISELTQEVEPEDIVKQLLMSYVGESRPVKGSDLIRVNGLSNYHCKLLSPLLTRFGMDKEGKARPIQELGHAETVDCGRVLNNRAFLISPKHVDIVGYGRDQSGADRYLSDLLDIIKSSHDDEERMIPIHADGDGHCLVHALSRAITGRELFWHALRDNLLKHLQKNLESYKNLLKEFIDEDDWSVIMNEADPYRSSQHEINEGLGNIHIFVLSNVLKRPIILLDAVEGIKNVADYSAVFVPALIEPSECTGTMPLCIAWSGNAHNHFVPLVGIEGRTLPSVPKRLLPNFWAIERSVALKYLNFNNDGSLTFGGGKPLQIRYISRLVAAMEGLFLQQHGVSAELVTDMHLCSFQQSMVMSHHLPSNATERTVKLFRDGKILRCVLCDALNVQGEDPLPGNNNNNLVPRRDLHDDLASDIVYAFESDGESFQCYGDATSWETDKPICQWCRSVRLRKIDTLGNILYENGDMTKTEAESLTTCCGKKHFWDGNERDLLPKQFILKISLCGKCIKEKVAWFYGDSNPDLNSTIETHAIDITEKYFARDYSQFAKVQEKICSAIQVILGELNLDGTRPVDLNRNVALSGNADTSSRMSSSSTPSKKDLQMKDALYKTRRDVRKLDESPGATAQPRPPVLSPPDCDDDHAKIRLCTPDGQQTTLIVNKNLDYHGLQLMAHDHFGVEPARQVLKLGFPPKPIADKGTDVPIGLKSRDRITVEQRRTLSKVGRLILTDAGDGSSNRARAKLPAPDLLEASEAEKSFIKTAKILKDMNLRETPKSKPHLSRTGADAAMNAVSNMAKITGMSDWGYASRHAELFRPGGAYYEQFRLDLGLEADKHYQWPSMPGMVFCYNVKTDEIELCLGRKGHHPIGPNITELLHANNSELDQDASGNVCSELDCTLSADEDKENDGPDLGLLDSPGKRSEPEGTEDEGAADFERKTSREDCSQLHSEGEGNKLISASSQLPEPQPDHSTNRRSPDGANNMKRQQGGGEKLSGKVPKLAPGFTILGTRPYVVSSEDADRKKQELIKLLSSKKGRDNS